jgi:flagellar biosynthesis chaperone FliJ
MKSLVNRRQRMLRVRHAQHAQSVAESMHARDAADEIAHNADRLKRVRSELFQTENLASGASFAAYRELATRLEQAGRQLDGALYDARRRVDEKEGLQVVASREREIAERLKDRARAAMDEAMEARIAALPRHRRIGKKEGQ